jgi:hypothetical protein
LIIKLLRPMRPLGARPSSLPAAAFVRDFMPNPLKLRMVCLY